MQQVTAYNKRAMLTDITLCDAASDRLTTKDHSILEWRTLHATVCMQ